MENIVTDLKVLLEHLSGPIGIGAWMLYVSNAFRNLRTGNLDTLPEGTSGLALWIRRLDSLMYQALVFIVSLGLPALAALILAYVPPEQLAKAQPAFGFITKLLLLYIVQQGWFKMTKNDNTKSVEVKTTSESTTVKVDTPVAEPVPSR